MPTVNVKWPQDANGQTFSIGDWIHTLTPEEQEEWNTANIRHNKMVADAAANGDAEVAPDAVHWKSEEVWSQYQVQYLTPEVRAIEEKYWTRFLEENNLTMSDIFGK